MPQLTIKNLEAQLQSLVAQPSQWPTDGHVRVETGNYKPFAMATVNAARRRGHGVVRRAEGVFHISPSSAFSTSCARADSVQASSTASSPVSTC